MSKKLQKMTHISHMEKSRRFIFWPTLYIASSLVSAHSRYGLLVLDVLDVAVAAGEVSRRFILVDAAVERGALQSSRTAGMTEDRVLVLHR